MLVCPIGVKLIRFLCNIENLIVLSFVANPAMLLL